MDATSRYDSLVKFYFAAAAERYRLDAGTDWRLSKAQMLKESSANPKAVNPTSGAQGLFQIEPATWRERAPVGADPFDPEANTMVGTDYLGHLWSEFKRESGLERWKFALASYDWGLENVAASQRAVEARAGDSTQWMSLWFVGVPAETLDYVRKIVAAYSAMVVAGA